MYWLFLLAAVVVLALSALNFVRYQRTRARERLIIALLQLTAGVILSITFFLSLTRQSS
jgi:hypothetical protein